MSEEKTLEDVIGFLMNVAEFDLAKTKRVPIPGGAMTVTSENYQYMSEIIDWIEAKFSEPKLNENQEIVLEYGKTINVNNFLEEMTCQHYRTPDNIQDAMNELDERESLEVMKMAINRALDQC